MLVHRSSARILCMMPCMILLVHVQGGCNQTGGCAEWTGENVKTSYEKRQIA